MRDHLSRTHRFSSLPGVVSAFGVVSGAVGRAGVLPAFSLSLSACFCLRADLALLQVLLAVEVDDAVDEHLLRNRERAERVRGVDHEVGVLADLDRADALVDAELLGRVERDQLERLFLGEAAVLHRLGRFLVQVPVLLGAVGVDRDEHAALRHQRRVVGDGVVRLDLVGPPVGERRGAGAVLRDLVGDLVALEHVLQRGDAEAEFLGDAQQLQDLVGAVGVRVHEALALEHLDQRLELEVARRRDGRAIARLDWPRRTPATSPW